MGKFDSIEKFLGKEESFSRQQIEAGLDSLDDIPSQISDVDSRSMQNVERLLQSQGIGSPQAASFGGEQAPSSGQSTSLPEEIMKEISALDGPPPSLDDLQSRFSSLRDIMTSMAEEREQMEETGPDVFDSAEIMPDVPSSSSAEDFGLSVPEGEVDNDLADLLGQMRVEKEQPTASSAGGMEELLSSLGIPSEEPAVAEAPPISQEAPFGEMAFSPEIPLETGADFESLADTPLSMDSVPMEDRQGGAGGASPVEPFQFPSFDENLLSSQDAFEAPSLEGFADETATPSLESPMDQFPLEDFSMQNAAGFESPKDFGMESFSEPQKDTSPTMPFDFDIGVPEPATRAQLSRFEQSPLSSTSQDILLDPEKAVKIRERINRIRNTEMRKRIREAIVKPELSEDILKELIIKLLLNEDDETLAAFDRQYLSKIHVKDRVSPTVAPTARRVIYTEEAVKAEKINKQLGKVGGLSLLVLLVSVAISAFTWVVVIRPFLAGREYEQGLAAIEQRDFTFAERKFQVGQEIGGFSVKWHNVFAQAYTEIGQWGLAQEKYERVLERYPLEKTTIMNYGEFKKQLYPPRYEEAIALYNRLYRHYPRDFEVVDALGQTYVEWAERTRDERERLERFERASDLYERYVLRRTRDINAHFRLLDIAIRVTNETLIDGRYDIIEEIDERAVNFPILTRLADYYIDQRRMSDARQVLNKLIPLIDIRVRETDGAHVIGPSMEKFAEQGPVYDETLYQYGRLQTINMDFERALWALSNAVGLNPSNARAFNLMGEIYFTTDDSAEARRMAMSLFETAQRIAPNYHEPYVNLGHLYFYNHLDFRDAEAALLRALGYYQVAYQLYRTGQIDQDSLDPKLFYNLAWLHYKYGNNEEALRVLSEIYVKDPLNPYYSFAIGNIYKRMGIIDLAEVNYLKAIDYFNAIAQRIRHINPNSIRHREVFMQLARTHNNLGTVYFAAAQENRRRRQEYESKALLHFYHAKDMADKIDVIYPEAEHNIKVILNRTMRGRSVVMDNTLVKRTSLHRLLDELRNRMIDEL